MPGKMVVILGALNVLWMVFVVSQAFKIEIFPKSKIIAQIGASVSLTCSTVGCESPSFSWRTQIDSPLSAKVRSEGNTSTLTMDPVGFENEHSYLCTATCGSGKQEKEIKVQIYSFPKDPEIYLSGPLEVGKLVTVTCLVPDVYPFDRLEMDLLKDNQNLKSQYFLEPTEKKSLETKSLEVTFTPTNEDTGKDLVCRAKLLVDEIDVEYEKRETTEKLQVYIAPRDTVIFVNPSTRLQEGDSVTMTCSSEGLPAPQILWSKKLDNSNLQLLSENATLTLIAMRMEDSGIYVCEGVNIIGRNRKEMELIVQEKSFTVEISPGPQVVAQVGDSVMLTCSATGCESPSFSWRTQIDSPLNGKVSSEGTTSTLTLSPVSLENEHSYLCTATCGHKKLEKGIKVDLYSFPRDPEIETSGVLVDGNPVTISCKVPHVYPLDRLEIELLKGESVMKSKHFFEDEHKKSLETKSLEITFVPTTEDTGKVLVCQAKLNIDEMEFEPKQRQSTQTIYVNGRESNKDYFSPELLMLYCASSLIIPAIGMIIYFARKANMKGSYSLVEAQKSKV
ncbi:vascular cell adhesion protein 1 isoform X3 [Rousettus aegyptiacus]|uniref:vascular cell adhesion protein 1 isoform X3 n=1 Tax=Rousettus aegyptiacus TaxID=9407 RepID=UPI00168D3FF1|nr:vascular cell adhesion protein 1 isoform X3 [Rousettus aegyptiacus]